MQKIDITSHPEIDSSALSDGTATFDQEDVVIILNGSSSLAGSLSASDVITQTLAGGTLGANIGV
jgi:hypothetical protein